MGVHLASQYKLNQRLLDDADSPASVRRICGTFSKQGINLGKTFVADTLNCWREKGDPTETQSGGDVSEWCQNIEGSY